MPTKVPPSSAPQSARLWPLGVVLAFALFITWPLIHQSAQVFSQRMEGDGILPVWFYDFIARYLPDGALPATIVNLDYPCANPLEIIPNYWDAILVSPLSLALDWPHQWNATMALILISNALALAFLARAAGARHLGVIFAGCMGVLSLPLWNELQDGRSNGAWPSIAFLTVAAFVEGVKWARDQGSWAQFFALDRGLSWRTPFQGAWPRLILLGILGTLTLTVYPLYALLLAPAGLILILPHLIAGKMRSLALLLAALILGMGAAAPTLYQMQNWRANHYQRGPTCEDTLTPCPHLNGHAYYGSLARLTVDKSQPTLEHASAGVGAWVLLALLFLVKGRRIGLLLMGGWIAILAYLSLGPCPSGLIPTPSSQLQFVELGHWKTQLWCRAWELRRMERFLVVALGLSGLIGGLGLEALWRQKSPFFKGLAALLALGALGQCTGLLMGELENHSQNWVRYEKSITAAYLKKEAPSVVAELPFDSSMQFLSDLEDNRHIRLNPFLPDMRTQSDQPALRFLHDLGDGKLETPDPSPEDWGPSGVHFVFYDPNRCHFSFMHDQNICQAALPARLEQVLGPAHEILARGVKVWRLTPDAGSQAKMMSNCQIPMQIQHSPGP